MKRKLIKIGKSTLLISLPREWVVANSLSKGDEIEATLEHDKITFWCSSHIKKDRLVLDVTRFNSMLPRLLYSVYRGGADEIELRSDEADFVDRIKPIVWKETTGFELIEQGKGFCRIVNISGKVENFGNIFRRLFFLNLKMGEEILASISKGAGFENIIYLEQENNRLAAVLIRSLNKYGSFGFKKIGPLYYIVQELERIGDHYKFAAQALMKQKGNQKTVLKPEVTETLRKSELLFRTVYELFYTFTPEKVEQIKNMRQKAVESILRQYSGSLSEEEMLLLNSSLGIASRSFDMVTSIIILNV